jgi:hypothetical protein
MTSSFSEIWVSPAGDDAAAGTRQAPFRTLRRAHEALRRSDASNITLSIADGTYRLDEPLRFDGERFHPDGPRVTVRAMPAAKPVVSGAVKVEGWTLHDQSLNIYRANVGAHRSRQLYVDGKRATRARTTANPPGFCPSAVLPANPSVDEPYVIRGGIEFIPTSLNPPRWSDPACWCNPSRIEAVIKTQWKMMSVPLAEIAPAGPSRKGLITLQQPGWTNANVFFDGSAGPGIWSFWQVTYFENAYEFLDQPGEWYLDDTSGDIFYIPRPGENLATADVELPVLEVLVEGIGTADRPVANLTFEGITFAYATWLEPGSGNGYVADQSGFRLAGDGHRQNIIGHDQYVVRTPGNLRFEYARNIRFEHNTFEHMGAVALDFGSGSQSNRIARNRFEDISSAAIQLGGVAEVDHHPSRAAEYTSDNEISDNRIRATGRDFVDSAAIYAGFTRNTLIANNTISDTPWSGIALGWGWGLLDPGSFLGVPGGTHGMWGNYTTPTANSGNRVMRNDISAFLQDRWDGGAIYFNGQQGPSIADPLIVEGNIAHGKRVDGGGNVFYSDGGSRYVVFRGNALFDNPIGRVDLGPPPQKGDPLPYPSAPSLANFFPYGGDIGGCRTYGDILYQGNYWRAGLIPLEETVIDVIESIVTWISQGKPADTYSSEGYFNICPYSVGNVVYPTGLVYVDNHDLPLGSLEVPPEILANAGVRPEGSGADSGISFPPAYSGPSWNVPRVSLPGLFGMQQQFGEEWWYYVGTAYSDEGQPFSLQIQITHLSAGSIGAGLGITGIGWRDGDGSHYLSGLGFGLGAAESAQSLPSVVIPPVTDYAYSASLVPLFELGAPPGDLLLNAGFDGWQFAYLSDVSNGRVGEAGSAYSIVAHGRGYTTVAGSAETTEAEYRVSFVVADRRGTVMEGISGYVGPQLFPGNQQAPSSYECAQPQLAIQSGTIVIDGRTYTIKGGSLWLDRQMIATASDASPAPRDAESFRQYLQQTKPAPKTLYLGDWMAFVLDNGHVIVLAEFWQPSTPQWLTGTRSGKPPMNGFGNLYFPVGDAPQANGGIGLVPRKSLQQEEWDFDVNVLDPGNGESPHWASKLSGHTYATAWQIEFSGRATAHGLPPKLYVFAISDNCEIVPLNMHGAFFEGAALVYADQERTQLLGHAFVEQMGFN